MFHIKKLVLASKVAAEAIASCAPGPALIYAACYALIAFCLVLVGDEL